MAKFTFSMESDDFHEVVAFINAAEGQGIPRTTAPKREPEVAARIVEEHDAAEVVEEQPAAKPTRTRKSKDADKQPEPEPEAKVEPETETAGKAEPGETHELLKEITLQDIKDKASEVLGKDPRNGAAVMKKLKEQFGVPAFGQLAAEDYARCYAMLEEF